MAKYAKIVIDNLPVDLPPLEELPFSISYKIAELGKGGSLSGSSAKRSISLPATKINKELFQHWGNSPTLQNEGAANLKNFYAEVDGLPVISGQAQLSNSDLKSGFTFLKASKYKVNLFGSNVDWFSKLETVEIKDLVFESRIFNSFNVITGWLAKYDNGQESGFCLIKYREWNTAGEVDLAEFTPFLFIRTIIDKAFASIGYSVESSFFESDFFERLILPTFPIEKYPDQYGIDYLNIKANKTISTPVAGILVGVPYDTQTVAPAIGPNPFTNGLSPSGIPGTTAQYTCPTGGFYEVNFSFVVGSILGPSPFVAMLLYVNGSPVTGVPLVSSPVTAANNGETFSASIVIEAVAGDLVEIATGILGGTYTITGGILQIFGEAKFKFGALIDFKYLLKDWKINDLILGLAHAFNLQFETDVEASKVFVEPMDSFRYTQRTPTGVDELRPGFFKNNFNDFTQKLDLGKKGEEKPINTTPRFNRYTWKDDSNDKTVEALEQNQELGIYVGEYQFPGNRFKEKIEVVENPFFAKTIHTFDTDIQNQNSNIIPQIPLIYAKDYIEDPTATDEDTDFDFEARLLYFAGFRGSGGFASPLDGSIDITGLGGGGGGGAPLVSAFMVNYNDPTGEDPSLSFANEEVGGVEVPGLLLRFYLQSMARLRVGKLFKAFIFWKALDILKLSFQDKLLIDGGRFILQAVDGYNPILNISTKTILLLDVYPKQQDIEAVRSTQLAGLANLILTI